MISIEVNGRSIDAAPGEMILSALRRGGIAIPTLCNVDGLPPTGACRMCVVELEGRPGLVPSCAFPVAPGTTAAVAASVFAKRFKELAPLILFTAGAAPWSLRLSKMV